MKAADIPVHNQYEVVMTEDDGPHLLVDGRALETMAVMINWDWDEKGTGHYPASIVVVLPGPHVRVRPSREVNP